MAKRRKKAPEPPAEAPPPPPPAAGVDTITLITLAGLVGALLVSFASWQKIGFIEERLDDRLRRIEVQVGQVVDNAARAAARPAQPQRRGPDPDRVYDIKTAGAPVKGAARAPITIAEFSDFQ
jgi:hypothetical protein